MSNTRQLMDGREVETTKVALDFKIHTKCMDKWVLVDTETGNVYHPAISKFDWDKASQDELKAAQIAIGQLLED
ncbi:hypothetical protein NVP1031O_066 [Vibrio phage 1.031.O._10N.261.46.F8]|nr:hypothetical protein NVP1031O_066 [Vibrio phage 1.031.O._10N.261.46.F8]